MHVTATVIYQITILVTVNVTTLLTTRAYCRGASALFYKVVHMRLNIIHKVLGDVLFCNF